MPETDITEEDLMRDPEPNDFTPQAIVRKLNRVTRVLTRVSGRLDVINARFGTPPEPVKPELGAALQGVRGQLTAIDGLVTQMEAKLR
jgi:hypothetical protein